MALFVMGIDLDSTMANVDGLWVAVQTTIAFGQARYHVQIPFAPMISVISGPIIGLASEKVSSIEPRCYTVCLDCPRPVTDTFSLATLSFSLGEFFDIHPAIGLGTEAISVSAPEHVLREMSLFECWFENRTEVADAPPQRIDSTFRVRTRPESVNQLVWSENSTARRDEYSKKLSNLRGFPRLGWNELLVFPAAQLPKKLNSKTRRCSTHNTLPFGCCSLNSLVCLIHCSTIGKEMLIGAPGIHTVE
jgi:hypothetical protein